MRRLNLPHFLFLIVWGLILLVVVYLFIFPFFEPASFIMLGLGVLLEILAIKQHQNYSNEKKMAVDSFGNPDMKLTLKNIKSGEMETVSGQNVRAKLIHMMQSSIQTALGFFVIGTVYAIIGLVTASFNGVFFWISLIIVLLLTMWNILWILISPYMMRDHLRSVTNYRGFKWLLFGKRGG